jgi:hypothetical protein
MCSRFPFRTSTGITTYILDSQPSLYNHDAESVNKRGWTSQESALAKRLLEFPSTGGLIARCDEGMQCFGEVLGNPFHEEAGLGGTVKDEVDSDEENDRGTPNVQTADPTVSHAEQIDERQREVNEGSAELLEQIFQGLGF